MNWVPARPWSCPPSVSPNSLDHGLHVHLQTRRSRPPSASPNSSITASRCISHLARSGLPSVSPVSLDYCLQVRTIMASNCISKLARSRPPSASLSSLDLSVQVHLLTCSIMASKWISEFTQSPSPTASQTRSIKNIFKEGRRLYGDTGVTEVDRVTGSIYSADRSQSRYSVSRWVAIQIHRYIDENTNWIHDCDSRCSQTSRRRSRVLQGLSSIARRCVNGFSITAVPAKSVTHVSFWWYIYVATK